MSFRRIVVRTCETIGIGVFLECGDSSPLFFRSGVSVFHPLAVRLDSFYHGEDSILRSANGNDWCSDIFSGYAAAVEMDELKEMSWPTPFPP